MHLVVIAICWIIKLNYRKLRLIVLFLISSVFLTACASTYVRSFDVDFDRDEALIVVKNTDIFKKCIPQDGVDLNSKYFIGVRCVFESRAPDEYTITYAVWMDDEELGERFYGKIEDVYDDASGVTVARYVDINGNVVTREEWQERAAKKINKALGNLPESAWQTYTIDSKNRLQQYKGKTPDGQPMGITIPIGWGIFLPSIFPSLQNRALDLYINIDKKGNIEVEEQFRWEDELPDNPYA